MAPPEGVPKRDPGAATLGILSVALLGASFVWAHHWGTLADTLVAAWGVATVGAFVFSIRSIRLRDSSRFARRLAMIGLVGGLVSIVALVLAGAVWAAGINPTGVCGGG